jgi:hypothetical protein
MSRPPPPPSAGHPCPPLIRTTPLPPAGIDDIVNGAFSATGLWTAGWNDAINQAHGRERVAASQLSMVGDAPAARLLPVWRVGADAAGMLTWRCCVCARRC